MTGKPTVRAHSRASSSVCDDAFRTGKDRDLGALHRLARFFLLAHQPRDLRRRADELDVRGAADFGEVGVLAQQAVAGMNGIDVGDFRCADYRRNIQIALCRAWRPDADGLIGKAHVQRVAVGLAVDGDRANAQLFAGTDDA